MSKLKEEYVERPIVTPKAEGEIGDINNIPGDTINIPGDINNIPGDTNNIPGDTNNIPGDTNNIPGEDQIDWNLDRKNEGDELYRHTDLLNRTGRSYREGGEIFRNCYFKSQADSTSIMPYVSHSVPFIGQSKGLKRFYPGGGGGKGHDGTKGLTGGRKLGESTLTHGFAGRLEDEDSPHDEERRGNTKRKKKFYTFQFKMAVIREAFKTTPFRAAEKFGLSQAQVSQWKRKYCKDGPQGFMREGKRK